ncbi:MAG: acyl-CoA thioesterase [Ignavibacteria bacterium]|nr:acyl-CoA thioesterase [Ignavibacteria bacterium]
MINNVTEIRTLYAHTDIMGVVNNTRYLEYFEAGRNELMRNMGYPYTKLEQQNIGLPLIEANVKYYSPAKYDDVLLINACLKELPTVKIKIYYEIKVGEKLIATGFTIHSFLDLKKFKPVRPPQDFMDLLIKLF